MAFILTPKALRHGLPVLEATKKFVSALEVDKAIAVNPEYFAEMPTRQPLNPELADETLFRTIEQGLKATGSWLRSAKKVTLRTQILLQKLHSGKLKAFGFPVHERDSNNRIEVPEFLLNEKCLKYHKSEFAGYERRFVDVLIVRSSDLELGEETQANPKIGRPAIKYKIQKVIAILEMERAINPAWSVKSIGELIFKRGKKEFPDDFFARDGAVKPGRSTIEKEYNKYKISK